MSCRGIEWFVLFSVERNRLGVGQFSGLPVEVLKNDLRVRISDPPFSTQFLRLIEDIVDLYDAIVRVQSVQAWDVWEDVAAPADVAFARAEFEFARSWAVAFVVFRNVVHAVVRSATELPHVFRDINGEAVV